MSDEDRPKSPPNIAYLCNLGYHSVFGNIDSEDRRDIEFLRQGWNNADEDQAYPYQTYIAEDQFGMIYFYEQWSPECYQGLKKTGKTRYARKTKDEIDDQFDEDFRTVCNYFKWIYHGTEVIKRKGCRYTITRFTLVPPSKFALKIIMAKTNPLYLNNFADEQKYFEMRDVNELVRLQNLPRRKVMQFLKLHATDWSEVIQYGDIVGLTFKLKILEDDFDHHEFIPFKIPVDSKYFKNAQQLMKSGKSLGKSLIADNLLSRCNPKRSNPMAISTLLALGLGYVLGQSQKK